MMKHLNWPVWVSFFPVVDFQSGKKNIYFCKGPSNVHSYKIWVKLFGLWCLTSFQQYFTYIVAVSFIGGENQSTRRKPQPVASN